MLTAFSRAGYMNQMSKTAGFGDIFKGLGSAAKGLSEGALKPAGSIAQAIVGTQGLTKDVAQIFRDVTGETAKRVGRQGLKKGLLFGGAAGLAMPGVMSSFTRPRYLKQDAYGG